LTDTTLPAPLVPADVDDELAATWAEYEARKRAWREDNPGAYPCEIEHAAATIAWELGL